MKKKLYKKDSNNLIFKLALSALDKWEVSGTKGKIPQEIKLISSVLGNQYNNSMSP